MQAQNDLKNAASPVKLARINETCKHALYDAKGRRLMKDHIASSDSIRREGGLQKVWSLFGKNLDVLITEMNEGLVA